MNILELHMTVGAPGCGKSTFAEKFIKEHPDISYLSSDKLRGIFGKGEEDISVSGKVFSFMERETDRLLSLGKSVCLDATFMHPKARKRYLDIAKKYNAVKIAHVFEVPRQTLIDRNKQRKANGGRDVGVMVIDMMLKKYVKPTLQEFDVVEMH